MSPTESKLTISVAQLHDLIGSSDTAGIYPMHVALAIDTLGAAADDLEALASGLREHCDQPGITHAIFAVGRRLEAVQQIVTAAASEEKAQAAQ
jgi:hypothetical protein